jgi:hypothetical protein
MSYLVHVHGVQIEAPTAEAALELAELYAGRLAGRQNTSRIRQKSETVATASVPEAGIQSKPPSPLLAKLQPMQIEALQAIASGGKEGLTDEELCAKLGLQKTSLGGLLSAISKHAKALDLRFEGELIAKDPIITEAGRRGYRYLPLPGLNTILRSLKSD